jgi:hypothetical protein
MAAMIVFPSGVTTMSLAEKASSILTIGLIVA